MLCEPGMKMGIWASVLLLLVIVGAAHGQESADFALPQRPNNAALNYSMAAALLTQPRTSEEAEAVAFIECELRCLPPQILEDLPEVVAILDNDLKPRGALKQQHEGAITELHEGAQKSKCAFDVDWQRAPWPKFYHYQPIRQLAKRACGVAKLAELRGDHLQSVQIYVDVIHMGGHIGQEPSMIPTLVGISLVKSSAEGMEGLLSRDLPVEAAKKMLAELNNLPPRLFHLDSALGGEAELSKVFCRHLAIKPDEVVKAFRKSWVFENELTKRLDGLESAEAARKLIHWSQEWQEEVYRFAEMAKQPYHRMASSLPAEDFNFEEMYSETQNDDPTSNPLLKTHLRALPMFFREVSVAEAKLDMARLLCAARLHKEVSGQYPETLKEIKGYFPNGLPVDPFTGKDYGYSLTEGLPRVECAVGVSWDHKFDWQCSFDLVRRRKHDTEYLADERTKLNERREEKRDGP